MSIQLKSSNFQEPVGLWHSQMVHAMRLNKDIKEKRMGWSIVVIFYLYKGGSPTKFFQEIFAFLLSHAPLSKFWHNVTT